MLNKSSLQKELLQAIEDYLKPALEDGMKATFPLTSELSDETATNFAETVVDEFAEPFASSLASAIDYYVKSISISGTVITTGSPAVQTAVIQSPKYITNGIVPNSFKIS